MKPKLELQLKYIQRIYRNTVISFQMKQWNGQMNITADIMQSADILRVINNNVAKSFSRVDQLTMVKWKMSESEKKSSNQIYNLITMIEYS